MALVNFFGALLILDIAWIIYMLIISPIRKKRKEEAERELLIVQRQRREAWKREQAATAKSAQQRANQPMTHRKQRKDTASASIPKTRKKHSTPGSDFCMAGKKLGQQTVLPDTFTVTEKLDGVRCLAICTNGTVKLLTRNANAINGYDNIRHALLTLGVEGVFDGELIATPIPGELRHATYQRTRSDLRAERGNMQFHIFDTLTMDEWRNRRGNIPYCMRRAKLSALSAMLPTDSPVQIVPVLYRGTCVEKAHEWMRTICTQGGEGVMINLENARYEFRRSDSLLKLKPVSDADLRIIDVLPGTGRNEGRAGSIVVEYKGQRVGVSSGLSAALRKDMLNHPTFYIGRVATIRYAEESTNSAGKVSLRFPVFVELREIGKDVSYA